MNRAILSCFLAIVAAQKYHDDIKENLDFQPNRRDHKDGGSNRNEWTQFEYGFVSGLMKVDLPKNQGVSCFDEGNKMFSAWTTLLVRYVTLAIQADADDEINEGDFDFTPEGGFDAAMLTSNFMTLSMDLAFRCNYVATV